MWTSMHSRTEHGPHSRLRRRIVSAYRETREGASAVQEGHSMAGEGGRGPRDGGRALADHFEGFEGFEASSAESAAASSVR